MSGQVRLAIIALVAAVCGVVHFTWRVKADLREPLLFAAVLAVLLAVRLIGRRTRNGVRS